MRTSTTSLPATASNTATRRTIPKPADRASWLAARRPYFNASAAACLWDRHPYLSAADYAIEKLTGRGQTETRAMLRGRYMESAIAEWFMHDQGVQLVEPGVLYIAGPLMATVDRITVNRDDRPVEIKTSNSFLRDPERYWLDQCQAILHCTGADVLDLAWVDASMDMRVVEVDADAGQQGEIVRRAETFMAAIELGMVPDWIKPELTASHVAALYPDPDGEIELDDETAELVVEFVNMRADVKRYEEAMDHIKATVAARLGEHAVGTYHGEPIVTFKAIKGSERVDVQRLRAERPDIVEQYVSTQPGGRRFLPVSS